MQNMVSKQECQVKEGKDIMKFVKMHGLGNDFVIVDCRKGAVMDKARMIAMADRRTGIGFDQLVFLESAKSPEADVFMDMYNSDGSAIEACGNASRCVADIILKEKGATACVLETVAGLLYCARAGKGRVTVDMGVPRLTWNEIPLSKECDTLHLPLEGDPVAVNIGNPHCIYFMDKPVEDYPVEVIGSKIEHHSLFPQRVNVEFVNVIDRATLRMRVWERGAGETQACGTGACASVVAAVRRGLTDRKCKVILNGGELDFHWRESDDHILMSGAVATVFKGELI